MLRCLSIPILVVVAAFFPQSAAAEEPTREAATEAMRKAARFFREHASASGSYVYRLSADLKKREGEGKVGPTTGWIEPPGTPSVGSAYLEAYQLTQDPYLLEAALETGMALVQTQLVSGGWADAIEFDPQERKKYAYRVDKPENPDKLRNTTTFDDDKTQSAMRFLMRLDRVLEFKNEAIHEAAKYSLESTLKAQYPNGAWPQRYSKFPDPAEHPVIRARYPDQWPREFPKVDYKDFYTLNDNTISDIIGTLLDAYDIYDDERYWKAALRGGDFFILAQMPAPQPGWAQQYNLQMEPAWARRFEPPAISGGESQGVMRTLITLYDRSGEERFLEPLPRALEYYRKSQLPDGRLARFYELKTNRPLYFTKDYELTYSSDDIPTHYAFIVGSRIDSIAQQYEKARNRGATRQRASLEPEKPKRSSSLARQASELAAALDDRGAWVESGRLRYHGADDNTRQIIDSRTFARNLVQLARFIASQ